MSKRTLAVAIVLTLLQPGLVFALKPSVFDTIAGFGTEISLSNLQPDEEVALSVTPPLGPPIPLSLRSGPEGKGSIELKGTETEVTGVYLVERTDTGEEASFTVHPGTIDAEASTIEIERSFVKADGEDRVGISVILRDVYFNPLPSRPVQLVSSRSDDKVVPLSSVTDENGEQKFLLSTLKEGTLQLRALDLISGEPIDGAQQMTAQSLSRGGPLPAAFPARNAGISGMARNGRALYGQASTLTSSAVSFHIEILSQGGDTQIDPAAPVSVPVNQDVSFRVSAIDAFGMIDEDYTGTIFIFTSDPKAILPPGPREFTVSNLGQKTFTLGLQFKTPGEQILYVENSTETVGGEVPVVVTGGDGTDTSGRSISIVSPLPGSTVGGSAVTIKGTAPPFINLIVTGGSQVQRSESDGDGFFEITVPLDALKTEYTFRVEETDGRFKSEPLTVSADASPPTVAGMTFTPENPEAGSAVEISVRTEPGLKNVMLKIGDQESLLTETAPASGIYIGQFQTPDTAGLLQPIIALQDNAGNTVEVYGSLLLQPKTLPIVRNVRAEPRLNGVLLKWDAIQGSDVSAYRVYVGEDPTNYAYSLDTDRPVSSATIAGLLPGKSYVFAVTALSQDDRESLQKSDPVEAMALGVTLKAEEGNGSILLQWSALPKTTPLSAFLLEYGVEKGSLTEQRTINGDLLAFALHDLINGVPYSIRLTPITTTGEFLRDLAAETEATPKADGRAFEPTAVEPLPEGLYGSALPPKEETSPPFHGGAPKTPETGLPPIVWWMAALGATFLLYQHWQKRRSMKFTAAFLREMEKRYRL